MISFQTCGREYWGSPYLVFKKEEVNNQSGKSLAQREGHIGGLGLFLLCSAQEPPCTILLEAYEGKKQLRGMSCLGYTDTVVSGSV